VDVKLNRKEISTNGLDIREHKDEKWTHIRINNNVNLNDILKLAKMAYDKN
jgi:hypothetical protein